MLIYSTIQGESKQLPEITGRKWVLVGSYFDQQEIQGKRNYAPTPWREAGWRIFFAMSCNFLPFTRTERLGQPFPQF